MLDIDSNLVANRLKSLGAELLLDQVTTIDWYEFGGKDITVLDKALLTRSVVSKIRIFFQARSTTNIGDSGGFFRLRKQDAYDLTFKYKAEKKLGNIINPFCEFEQKIDDSKVSVIKSELSALNFFIKAHHEKKRVSFLYKGIRFDIDTWPGLPSYIEIEAPKPEDVYWGVRLLGLQNHEISEDSGQKLFNKYNKNFWSNLYFPS